MVGPSRQVAAVVLAVALAGVLACRGGQQLTNIGGVEALQQQFDQDAGKPRILLLLSPT